MKNKMLQNAVFFLTWCLWHQRERHQDGVGGNPSSAHLSDPDVLSAAPERPLPSSLKHTFGNRVESRGKSKKNTAWHLCQQSSDLLSHPLLATTLLLRYAELQIFKLCSYCNHVLRSPKRKINLNPTFVETLTISKDKSKMSSKIRIINTHCAQFSLEILSNDTDMVLSGLSTVTGAVFLKRD